MLTPPVPAAAVDAPSVVAVVDLPCVEPGAPRVLDLAAELAVADTCPADTTVASLVTQRGTRRGRSRTAASAAARGSDADGPGPAA